MELSSTGMRVSHAGNVLKNVVPVRYIQSQIYTVRKI